MSDALWGGIIGASAGLITALVTQCLAAKQANRQADRSEKQQERQWQRSEALRLEDLQRKEAEEALAWERAESRRKQELQDSRLRELWGHVLVVRWQVLDAVDRLSSKTRSNQGSVTVSAENLPAHAAGLAYAVALIGLPAVRSQAKAFYSATARVQQAIASSEDEAVRATADEWQGSFKALEDAVAALSDGITGLKENHVE